MTTNVSASMVKELRDQTGAGMMDCKAALSETGGNLDAAVDWLRKKGLSKAAKKAGESTCPTSAGCRKPLSSDAIWANAQIRTRNTLILNGAPL